MKSVIKEGNITEKGFPKLMVSTLTNNIVLFTEPGKGTVVHSKEGGIYLGYYSEEWELNSFKDFNGTIELSND